MKGKRYRKEARNCTKPPVSIMALLVGGAAVVLVGASLAAVGVESDASVAESPLKITVGSSVELTAVETDEEPVGASPIESDDGSVELSDPIPNEEIPMDEELQLVLVELCEEYRVPIELALAVIQTESSFRPHVTNSTCYGYMQVNLTLADWLYQEIGVADLKDPVQNIEAGLYILGGYLSRYDVSDALLCYNAGEQGANDYYFSNGIHDSEYSDRVFSFLPHWEEVLAK